MARTKTPKNRSLKDQFPQGLFLRSVHAYTARIPRGKVATYGQIAQAIGRPGASRAVGNALNKNRDTKGVPCHRVIRSDGRVGGYAFNGTDAKAKLLKKEGIEIKNGRIDVGRFGYFANR
jgi:methylated-DNA-protein-cysteine methyltransferase related protein